MSNSSNKKLPQANSNGSAMGGAGGSSVMAVAGGNGNLTAPNYSNLLRLLNKAETQNLPSVENLITLLTKLTKMRSDLGFTQKFMAENIRNNTEAKRGVTKIKNQLVNTSSISNGTANTLRPLIKTVKGLILFTLQKEQKKIINEFNSITGYRDIQKFIYNKEKIRMQINNIKKM